MPGSLDSHGRLDRLATATATILGVVAVVAVLTAARMAVRSDVSWSVLIDGNEVTNALLGVTFGVLGAVAVADRPRNGLSWLFVVEGQANALTVLGARWLGYSAHPPPASIIDGVAVVATYSWIPGLLLLTTVLPLLFPSGHWLTHAWGRVGRVAVAFTVVATALAFTTAPPVAETYPGRHNRLAVFAWSATMTPLVVAAALTLVFAAVGLACLVLRFRRGDRTVRAQVGWLFLALIVNLVVTASSAPLAGLVGGALLAFALGLAVVRYRLYDLDRLFTRTAVYLILTSGVVAVFALSAWAVGSQLNGDALGAILASVVVVLGLGPTREWLQHALDRLMYGRRGDPYDVLAGLGRQLEQPQSTSSVLAALAEAVAESLRLPYVAISLPGQDQPVVTAGRLLGASVDQPLIHAGRPVGTLTVGLRRGERRLSARDAALLGDIARVAAAAAHEVTLADDLRMSRERLVVAREEERRRLRRELHDGLGPALAGLALEVGAAGRAAGRGDAPAAAVMLAQAQGEVDGLLADVRRISRDLTPAALDELGLVGALEQRAAAVSGGSGGSLDVRVDATELPALAGAVEVAAYRIATEALSNTVRHAAASRCTIRLRADRGLLVEVSDDGRGLPDPPTPGVGLPSMAERAAEVGGTFAAERGPDGGTTIRARLPLAVRG